MKKRKEKNECFSFGVRVFSLVNVLKLYAYFIFSLVLCMHSFFGSTFEGSEIPTHAGGFVSWFTSPCETKSARLIVSFL
jgi:hypothetical protein